MSHAASTSPLQCAEIKPQVSKAAAVAHHPRFKAALPFFRYSAHHPSHHPRLTLACATSSSKNTFSSGSNSMPCVIINSLPLPLRLVCHASYRHLQQIPTHVLRQVLQQQQILIKSACPAPLAHLRRSRVLFEHPQNRASDRTLTTFASKCKYQHRQRLLQAFSIRLPCSNLPHPCQGDSNPLRHNQHLLNPKQCPLATAKPTRCG